MNNFPERDFNGLTDAVMQNTLIQPHQLQNLMHLISSQLNC
jgi:hypothetical protein